SDTRGGKAISKGYDPIGNCGLLGPSAQREGRSMAQMLVEQLADQAAATGPRAAREFGPNWFAAVMGTGIVAVAGAQLPVHVAGLRMFATVVGGRGAPL